MRITKTSWLSPPRTLKTRVQREQYRKAHDCYLEGMTVKDTAEKLNVPPRRMGQWYSYFKKFSIEKRILKMDYEDGLVEAQRDKFLDLINNTLAVVEKSVQNLQQAIENGETAVTVKEIESLTKVAQNLHSIADLQNRKDKGVTKQKMQSIRNMDDIKKILQEADPFVDYSQLIADANSKQD